MITILCSGSRGDIQSYIALAVELKRLGKDVRIASGKSFQEFTEGYGISYYPLVADYQTFQKREQAFWFAADKQTAKLK